ncbi:MAG: class A beta-lactamase-related serine hydrolase [Spirochaetaceae bacterium]|nr:MAG: class A beta-lactamase-related serine hydrolase [Spirochaetaceae bacterium]
MLSRRSSRAVLPATVLILAGLIVCLSGCERARYSGSDSMREFSEHLDRTVPALMRRYDVPGAAIAVVRGGVPVWSAAYGYADRESRAPLTIESVFQVGSISKPVTAWGVMRLAERGVIELDAPVSRYLRMWELPASSFNLDGITVRRLLSNTAGMPLGSFGNEYAPWDDVPTLTESLSREARLTREPGAAFSYSNVGFNLLELVIEQVSGEDFSAFMTSEVLAPVGMDHASFSWSESMHPAIATGHNLSGTRVPVYVYPEKASGGLFSDVAGIARFVAAGMTAGPSDRSVVIDSSSRDLLYSPVAEIRGIFGVVSDSYGLGHFIENLPGGQRAVWHGGQGNGWMSHFHSVPETGDGIVILTNSQRSWPVMARILGDWARWSGLGTVAFARISVAVTVLWVAVVLGAVAVLAAAVYVVRGVVTGERSFDPFCARAWTVRAAGLAVALVVIGSIVWASAQPYLMVTSVFPGVTDWAAIVLLALAVPLIAAALFPRRA